MITIPELIKIDPESVFAKGECTIPELHPEQIRWVAVRGQIHDWCIYYHFANHTYHQVEIGGDKIKNPKVIKQLVNCSDDAFKMYRL